MQCFHVAQDVIESVETLAADAPRDFALRAFPMRRRGGERGDPLPGQRDLAFSRIATRNDGQQLALGQRVEIARQRRAVEQVSGGEIADGQRAVPLQRAQQRELRDPQAHGLQRIVVELRDGTRGTA